MAVSEHGAYSERSVAPLADKIAGDLLASPSCPPFLLADDSYAPAIRAWAEAVCELLRDFLAGRDLLAAMAETSKSLETEQRVSKSKLERRSSQARAASVLNLLDRWERSAAHRRAALGLDPLSRAKLAADMGAAQWYGGKSLLDRRLDEIAASRSVALERGTGD